MYIYFFEILKLCINEMKIKLKFEVKRKGVEKLLSPSFLFSDSPATLINIYKVVNQN